MLARVAQISDVSQANLFLLLIGKEWLNMAWGSSDSKQKMEPNEACIWKQFAVFAHFLCFQAGLWLCFSPLELEVILLSPHSSLMAPSKLFL